MKLEPPKASKQVVRVGIPLVVAHLLVSCMMWVVLNLLV